MIWLNEYGEEETLRQPKITGQKAFIIPRHLCSFRSIKSLGQGKTAVRALRLQLCKEALLPNQYFHIDVASNNHKAYIWSFPEKLSWKGRCLPESLLFSPLDKGARLVRCRHGIEGQIWDNKVLISSRWWKQAPSEEMWHLFFKMSPVDIEDDGMPPLQTPVYRHDLPFIHYTPEHIQRIFSPRKVLAMSSFASLLLMAFFLTQYIRYATSLRAHQNDIDIVGVEAREVLSQKRRAIKNMSFPLKLSEMGDRADLPLAFYALAKVLKDETLILSTFDLRNKTLKLTFTGNSDVDGPKLVTRLEAVPVLENVNVNFDTLGRLNLETELKSDTLKDTLDWFARHSTNPSQEQTGTDNTFSATEK